MLHYYTLYTNNVLSYFTDSNKSPYHNFVTIVTLFKRLDLVIQQSCNPTTISILQIGLDYQDSTVVEVVVQVVKVVVVVVVVLVVAVATVTAAVEVAVIVVVVVVAVVLVVVVVVQRCQLSRC